MGHTACTEPQCLYKGVLYLLLNLLVVLRGHYRKKLRFGDISVFEDEETH